MLLRLRSLLRWIRPPPPAIVFNFMRFFLKKGTLDQVRDISYEILFIFFFCFFPEINFLVSQTITFFHFIKLKCSTEKLKLL
jgi:hypothetical protein